MLVDLGLVEQRYKAVMEVLDGATVVDVARRNGVVCQTVHDVAARLRVGGLAGLADGSWRPQSCPHQMAAEVEAAILELRRAHPGWGPRTIGHRLERDGVDPVPGRSSIYRCLVRHGLIDPQARRKRRSDYKRWGALPGHGAVADGHRGRRRPHRRKGGQDRHRRRRPLEVLCPAARGGSGHGHAHV